MYLYIDTAYFNFCNKVTYEFEWAQVKQKTKVDLIQKLCFDDVLLHIFFDWCTQ